MKNIKNIVISLVLIIILAVGAVRIFSVKTPPQPNTNKKLQIVTSFYPLYFFASQIGGEKATIYNVTPAGAEPHDYELTTEDRARIEDSNLLIVNGAKLEPWGDKIKNQLSERTIIVSAGENLATGQTSEGGHVIQDPHVWLDPVLAKKQVETIVQGFVTADSANADYYQQNAQNFEQKLTELDVMYRTGLQTCEKKDIITSHTAFGYLAKEYNFNQIAIAGLSPDAEPSAADLARVADFAKKNDVHYIFFESLVSPKLATTIAEEVGAKTLVLNPIEGLSNDEIQSGKNYLTEMQNNLTHLRTALQCR